MHQDTLLIAKSPDIFLSVSRVEKPGNGTPNLTLHHLPEQFYRENHSMRTKQPINHSFVASAAFFVFPGIVLNVGPLQSNLCYLCHPAD